MKKLLLATVLLSFSFLSAQEGLTPVSFDKVTLTGNFWSDRMQIQKEVLIPVAFERTQEAVNDLRLTGEFLKMIIRIMSYYKF
ncbi:MAG: hypothetical protein LUD02_09630 [Tannerellaceae bacterium]|nr:hypothetical protein [Tannerellaceae bacterium]